MNALGKLLFITGLVLADVGAVIGKTGGLGPLGRLPGDITLHKGSSTFYFPIVTCLLPSTILTLLAWHMRKRTGKTCGTFHVWRINILLWRDAPRCEDARFHVRPLPLLHSVLRPRGE